MRGRAHFTTDRKLSYRLAIIVHPACKLSSVPWQGGLQQTLSAILVRETPGGTYSQKD